MSCYSVCSSCMRNLRSPQPRSAQPKQDFSIQAIDSGGNVAHMVAWFGSVSRCFQEALIRFYWEEQTQEGICKDMQLTEAQFVLLKKRTKTNFGANWTVGDTINTHDWDETVEQYSMGRLQGDE